MKKYIKNIISGFVFGLALLGSFGLADAAWNTYPTDCPNPLSIGNYTTGEGIQDGTNGCWTKKTVSASGGDTINLAVFYDNTNSSDARYTMIKLVKSPSSGEADTFSFSGNLTSAVGGLSLGTVKVNISSSQTLTYNQAKWYKNGSSSGVSVDGQTAFGTGLSLGNIPKGDWGTVLLSFKISDKVEPKICSISSFTASDYSIDEGESSVLSWSTENCTSAKISNVGNVSTNGNKTVYPTSDTTYTLTAYGSDGSSKTKSLTIDVDEIVIPEYCSISSFTASDYSIDEGESSVLSWSTENCTSAKISNVGNVGTNGNKTVYPTSDTTYVLTAYGYDGSSKTKSLSINVDEVVIPEYCSISSFTASDYSIDEGESSVLSWSTENCTSAKISNVGNVATNGNKTVYPTSDTTYTLTAYGSDGSSKTKSLTIDVSVVVIPPTDSCTIYDFSADKSSIQKGDSVTISWSTSGCSLINIPGVGYGLSASGAKTISPTSTKTYKLSAYSLSSFSVQTKTLEISVLDKPVEDLICSISSFTASQYSVNQGNSSYLSWSTDNCVNANISNIGSVSTYGSRAVYPSSDTTYTLTAYGANGNYVTKDLRIYVNENNQFCRVEISASDTRIDEGDYTILEWEAEGCEKVKITDIGYVSDYGTRKVYPDEDITYKLTAYDYNNNVLTDSVRIYVEEEDDDDDYCQIDSFTLSNPSINYGESTTLRWRTSDCEDVYISGIGYVDDDGSEVVYPYTTTTYTLRAEGSERSRSKSVRVNVGSYQNPVTPVPAYNAEVVTTVATNITENSAYLNGLISSSSFSSNNVYFEYGQTVNLGSRTPAKVTTYNTNFNYYLTGLKANTIYYFRAVAEGRDGNVYRGAIQIFKTAGTTYVAKPATSTTKTTVVTQGKTVYGQASPIVLEIGNKYQTFNVGDEIEYFVYYKNISDSILSYPMIQVYIPEGIEVRNISNGTYSERDRILSIPIPNLRPSEEGIVYIRADVDSLDNELSQIVTTAVLVYTNPNGAQENAMAYVLNTPGNLGNMLGASAFLGGFGNFGLIGWLLIILLILLIVLTVRSIYRKKDKEEVKTTTTSTVEKIN